MTKLRVLIPVDHAVGVSGPHRHVVGSLNALGARDDVEVVLLTSIVDKSEPYARSRNVDAQMGFLPHDPRRVAANLWRIQKAARGCDAIYVPSGLKAFLFAQTVRVGKRLVAGPNVTPLPIGRRPDSPGTVELKWMSDAWFEASRARRDHVRKVSGVGSVAYIHHAIDTNRFSPAHQDPTLWERLGVRRSGVHVLYVGKDYRLKGVKHLLDAAEILSTCADLDIHFVLAGNMSDETKTRAGSLPNVSLVGFRKGDELAALYATASMSVVPSSWENCPFVVLEAMASGVPVIGSRAGGIPELVLHEETGLLIDIVAGRAHKPDAGSVIAAAVQRLATDAKLRRELGRNARRRVLEHFSEERLGSELIRVLQGERLLD